MEAKNKGAKRPEFFSLFEGGGEENMKNFGILGGGLGFQNRLLSRPPRTGFRAILKKY